MRTDIKEMLKKLLHETKKREIRWEETIEEDTFRVGFPDGLIAVNRDTFHEGKQYTVQILNEEGKEIATITDGNVETRPDPDKFKLLENLFTEARASALKVDETIEGLTNAIGEGKTRDASDFDEDDPPADGFSDDDIPF